MDLLITTFPSRKTSKGKLLRLTWDELKDKFRKPVITDETLDEYAAMTNEERTDIKDVGGFVGGEMVGGRRNKNALRSRCLVTIDADYASLDDPDAFTALYDYTFCCHTTHTSTDEKPRLRWVFPLTRTVDAEDYRVLAAILGAYIGVETLDDSTDQPERLMFWPSASWDADYHFWEHTDVLLDPDELLGTVDGYLMRQKLHTYDDVKVKVELTEGQLVVAEGHRNKTVFSFAATLRGAGVEDAELHKMVAEYNEAYCHPPLEDYEVETICRSVCSKYKPGDPIHSTLRTAWDDFEGICDWNPPEVKKPTGLQAISLATLTSMELQAPKFTVPGLIPAGLTVLASPPKFGKSWYCLDLAISVATGTPFLDIPTNQTGVIYLALEDGEYRLADRSRKVAGDRPMPHNLHIVREAPSLAEGLVQQLAQLIDSCNGKIGMVIIDTLQKVRGQAGKNEGVYGYDYRELGELQKFAINNGISLVLVHHTNKGSDDSDFFNRLNGSTGIAGAADCVIVLSRRKRSDKTTVMQVSGRDVQEKNFVLQMDWSIYRWLMLGEEEDVRKDETQYEFDGDPVVKTVQYLLDSAEELADESIDFITVELTSKDLAEKARLCYGLEGESSTSIGMRVRRFAPIFEKAGIAYEYKRNKDKRTHCFRRERI